MSEMQIKRRLTFCAGHRVVGHEGKCKHIHGHNYVVYVHCAGVLDSVGRVIDFSVLKSCLGTWLDRNWDHKMIAWVKDTVIYNMARAYDAADSWSIFELPYNPTAENLAKFLLENVCPIVFKGTGIKILAIEVQETENCTACAIAPDGGIVIQ